MNRITTGLIPVVALGLLVSLPGVASAHGGGHTTTVTLTGAVEVPVLGDPDGTGTFTMNVRPSKGEICYTFAVSGVDTILAAHIHEAPAGAAGPVVVPLTPPASGSSMACATVTRELAKDIRKNPADYYVNVHNTAFPGGALRAQLG